MLIPRFCSTLRKFFLCLYAAALLWSAAGAQAQETPDLEGLPQKDEELAGALQKQAALPDPVDDAPQVRCAVLRQRGSARLRLGQYQRAIADLQQALALALPETPGSEGGCHRFSIQTSLAQAYGAAGEQFALIQHWSAVAAEWQHKNPRFYFYSQIQSIPPLLALGMLPRADAAFQRAEAVLPQVRQRREWPLLRYQIEFLQERFGARLLQLHGKFGPAEKLDRAALESANLFVQAMTERFGADSPHVRQAKGSVSAAMGQLASMLAKQGKLGEAEYLASEVLRQVLSQSAFNTVPSSNALSMLAMIKLQQGKLSEAARYSEIALKALQQSGVAPFALNLAGKRAQLGLIRAMQERWPEALDLFAQRDQGLRGNPAQWARFGSANIDWALALLNSGQEGKAAAMLNRMLDAAQHKRFVPQLQLAYVHGYLAATLSAQGADSQALAHFQQALPALLQRAHIDAESEESGYVRVYRLRVLLDAYLELLARQHAAGRPGMDWGAEAFRIADVARNSSVQRALTASAARSELPDPKLADLARREQDASNRVHALDKMLSDAVESPDEQHTAEAVADLKNQLSDAGKEQAVLRRELSSRFPDYASLIDPQPASPADIQRKLQPGEVLLSIYSGRRQSYVWTVTPQQVSWHVVPLSASETASEVAQLRQGLDISDGRLRAYDVKAAYRLYAALLAPDADRWAKAKLLDIIPHGALGELPFAALLTAPAAPVNGDDLAAYAKLPWLIDKVALTQQSSASGFLALRGSQTPALGRKPFIGFGDPLFSAHSAPAEQRSLPVRLLQVPAAKDVLQPLVEQAQQSTSNAALPLSSLPTLAQAFSLLPALPDTADEIREIARTLGADPQKDLFLGARANKGNLKRVDLAQYRVLAFATHGLKAGELAGLDQPALALSNPALTHEANDDGFLKLDDVLGLKLNADWVVLSACNTASADGSGSEAVSGLGRGFFYAGARSVLVSNWAVDSASARLLTTGLFRQQASHAGMTRAEALRQAMLALKKSHPAEYGHPVFWAPFSLVGDGLGR